MGDKAAAAAISDVMKGNKLGRQGGSGSEERNHEGSLGEKVAAAAKSEIMKGDKLGRQGGSGSQKRNHEGRQAWETRRQRQRQPISAIRNPSIEILFFWLGSVAGLLRLSWPRP